MCVFVFVCICVCLRLSVFVYVCVYVCMYICICIYEYICTSMYVYGRRERGRARNITINTSEEERKFINLYVHAHVRTYIFTYIYPHIHTHRCITRPKGSSVAWSLSVYHSSLGGSRDRCITHPFPFRCITHPFRCITRPIHRKGWVCRRTRHPDAVMTILLYHDGSSWCPLWWRARAYMYVCIYIW